MAHWSIYFQNHILKHVLNWRSKTISNSNRGRKAKLQFAYILDRIFVVCKTGCQWNQLHVDNGSWKTVWHYFNIWSKCRLFEHAFYDAVSTIRCGAVLVDTSFVKNVLGVNVIGRNPTDRGRNATKISLLTSQTGIPIAVCFHKAIFSAQPFWLYFW